jgi:hypothetical protein
LEARVQRGQRIELLCGESEDFHLAIVSDIGGTRESIQMAMSPNIIPGEKVAMRLRASLSIDTDTLAAPETRIYISLGVSRAEPQEFRRRFRSAPACRHRKFTSFYPNRIEIFCREKDKSVVGIVITVPLIEGEHTFWILISQIPL